MSVRILHIGLLITVLFSSTSLILNKHFCSNVLVNQTLMTVPGSCHSEDKAEDTCPLHAQDMNEDCCSNESQLLKTELNHDLYQPQFKTFTFTEWAVISVFLFQSAVEADDEAPFTLSKDWHPPSPTAVYLPRIQQFLC